MPHLSDKQLTKKLVTDPAKAMKGYREAREALLAELRGMRRGGGGAAGAGVRPGGVVWCCVDDSMNLHRVTSSPS
jgi:hypothetical protein